MNTGRILRVHPDRILCRLCLVADVKLYNLNDNSLEELRNSYFSLVNVTVCSYESLSLYPHICYQCLALLKKFRNFQRKCQLADQIVRNLKENVVWKIHREKIGLASTLSLTKCLTVTINPVDGLKNNIITIESDDADEDQPTDIRTDIGAETNKIITIDCGNICIDEQINIDADCNQNLDGDFHKKLDVDFDINLDVDFDKELDVDYKENLNLDFYEELNDFNSDSDDSVNNNSDDSVNNNSADSVNNNSDDSVNNNSDDSVNNDSDDSVNDNSDDSDTDESVFNFDYINPHANVTQGIVKDYAYSYKRRRIFHYLKGVATIKRLTPEEASKAVEERKETKKNRNTLNCNICNSGYYMQSTLDKHMKKHDPNYGDSECEYCHTRFLRRQTLCIHLQNNHTWKFECHACSHVCFDVYTAKNHADTHSEKLYKCDLCSVTFKVYKTLLWHKRTKHASNVLACGFCGDVFANGNGIRLHVKVAHEGQTEEPNGPYCDVCDVRFATDVACKRHFVLSDKHRDISGCGVCGEVLNKSELRKHARKYKHAFISVRHTMWPIECRCCHHLLSDQDEYQHHMSKAHPNFSGSAKYPRSTVKRTDRRTVKKTDQSTVKRTNISTVKNKIKPFICELCGMQFRLHCLLKTHHQVRHEGERPYKCNTCGESFATQSQRIVHESMHVSVEERTCDICGKVMKYRHNIKRHKKRVHLGVRPHKCTMCDRSFPTACEVKYHIQYSHHKVPWPKAKQIGIRGGKRRGKILNDVKILNE